MTLIHKQCLLAKSYEVSLHVERHFDEASAANVHHET